MREVMLTTFDNPFDPFTEFDSWLQFDMENGYNSCGYLSRIAITSDSESPESNVATIEEAIDEIIKYDLLLIYKKVVRET